LLLIVFLNIVEDSLVTHCDALMKKMLDAGFWMLEI